MAVGLCSVIGLFFLKDFVCCSFSRLYAVHRSLGVPLLIGSRYAGHKLGQSNGRLFETCSAFVSWINQNPTVGRCAALLLKLLHQRERV